VENKYVWDRNHEDIHTDIQNKLAIKVGDLVQKLHTAVPVMIKLFLQPNFIQKNQF